MREEGITSVFEEVEVEKKRNRKRSGILELRSSDRKVFAG